MAPRHHLLLLVAAACCLLAVAAPTPTRAAHEPQPHDLAPPGATAFPRTTAAMDAAALRVSNPPSVRSAADLATTRPIDGVLLGAEGGGLVVPPHLMHPAVLLGNGTDVAAVERTVYDVTVIFGATCRLGPPRVRYYVVPAAADVPSRLNNNDDDGSSTVMMVLVFVAGMLVAGLIIGCTAIWVREDNEEARSGGGAAPRKTTGGSCPGLSAAAA